MTGFQHILVPTDFGEASDRALDLAIEIGRRFDATITLLHTTWMPPYSFEAYAEGLPWPTRELRGEAQKGLDAAVERARSRYPKVTGKLAMGDAWDRILEAAMDHSADLIVMGTRGRRGVAHALLGSITEKVVRLSPTPVLTVSAEAERREKKNAFAEIRRHASKHR